jgi:hypothetical protein
MKRRILASLAGTILVLAMFLAVAPALASQPKGTYTFGEIDITTTPPTQTFTGPNIVHNRGSESINYMFGAPWGNSITPGIVTGIANLNLETVTGEGLSHFVDSYPTGTMEGSTAWKVVGAGMWIYQGPTMTAAGMTIVHGVTLLIGIGFEGTFVGHGTDGLDGVKWSGEYQGVVLVDLQTGNPTGVEVVWGPATYMYTGQSK